MEPEFVEYEGDDPIAFIVSLNLNRRHLEVGQRAAIGVQLLPPLEEEARKLFPMPASGRPRSESGQLLPLEQGAASVGKSSERAGRMVGVSHWSITQAKRLHEQNSELFQEVKTGVRTLRNAVMTLQQSQLGLIGNTATSVISDWKPSYKVREDIGNSQSSADEVTSGTGAGFVAETLNRRLGCPEQRR